MIKLDFLQHLDKLSLIINKRITSNYSGERQTTTAGKGISFKDYTIYAPGDDIRRVDWKVYARTDKLFTKRYEEERNLTVHIIVDFSASMNYGHNTLKSEYASMLGIGFAYLALKNNERFVLSTFSDKLEVFKPKKGRKQLITIVDYLNKREPKGFSKLEESLSHYKKLVNTKSLVVIISDFLYPAQEIKNVVRRFKKHDLVLIQVLDKKEEKLDLEGDFKLIDSETKEVMRTQINPALRKTYLKMLAEHNAQIKKACEEVGAKFYTTSTETPIFDSFYRILADY